MGRDCIGVKVLKEMQQPIPKPLTGRRQRMWGQRGHGKALKRQSQINGGYSESDRKNEAQKLREKWTTLNSIYNVFCDSEGGKISIFGEIMLFQIQTKLPSLSQI